LPCKLSDISRKMVHLQLLPSKKMKKSINNERNQYFRKRGMKSKHHDDFVDFS